MRILGINAGNGVLVYPMRKHLVACYEPRSVFKTPDDIQWKLNFETPLYSGPFDLYDRAHRENLKNIDVVISAPDCGHSSILAYSRAKKLSNPKDNYSFNVFKEGSI